MSWHTTTPAREVWLPLSVPGWTGGSPVPDWHLWQSTRDSFCLTLSQRYREGIRSPWERGFESRLGMRKIQRLHLRHRILPGYKSSTFCAPIVEHRSLQTFTKDPQIPPKNNQILLRGEVRSRCTSKHSGCLVLSTDKRNHSERSKPCWRCRGIQRINPRVPPRNWATSRRNKDSARPRRYL